MESSKEVIEKVEDLVRLRMQGETTGHDWHHVSRVRNLALYIGKEEGADLFIVELAALLHDIEDWKVCRIIDDMDFKGANVPAEMGTKDGEVVYDADKLDAIGAVGIARVFATSHKLGNPIHDPDVMPKLHNTFEEYKTSKSTAINHFYEKLLLLKGRFHTTTAQHVAQHRHAVLENFLGEFFMEWDLKDVKIS